MKRKIQYKRLMILVGFIIFILICAWLLVRAFLSKPSSELSKPAEINTLNTDSSIPDLSSFLKTSLSPVGKVMYIWGGGWNEEDTGAGVEATRLGLAPAWVEFTSQQDSSYDYEDHLYEIHNGLDCSGFVGWVLYNTFEHEDGKDGYVALSGELPSDLAQKGWGKLIPAAKIDSYEPGDILGNEGHIYIVLGEMEDGSVLLVHSSPPGVQISGTPTPNGDLSSQAILLANSIMSERYTAWSEKYPNHTVDLSYLQGYDQFRWDPSILTDVHGLKKMPTDSRMDYLFSSLEN
ncbi:hypothetical protein [Dubosiella newyorkensis]|jgi:hypothetical protein|nr:hypothetical protein [Dubosiella newyorkensis]